jgi:hypothetical protein
MEEVGGFARHSGDVVILRRHGWIMMLAELTWLILAQNKTADGSDHVGKGSEEKSQERNQRNCRTSCYSFRTTITLYVSSYDMYISNSRMPNALTACLK